MLVLPELDTLAEQSEVWVEKVKREGGEADLIVERVQGVVHGWTQFPDAWLGEQDREVKAQVMEKARAFVEGWWSRNELRPKDKSDP